MSELAAEHEELTEEERLEHIKRLSEYAAQVATAKRDEQRNSIDRAEDAWRLWNDGQWVSELPEPLHKTKYGRPVDPKAKDRFGVWAGEQTGLARITTTRLIQAWELIRTYLSQGKISRPTTERSLRPFNQLRKAGWGEYTRQVYEKAVKLAGGVAPTSAEVKLAISEFLSERSPQQREFRTRNEIALCHRGKAQSAVYVLWNDDVDNQSALFHEWYLTEYEARHADDL